MQTTLSEKARAFLQEQHFAVLATLNEDGSPQLTPAHDDDSKDTIVGGLDCIS